jgi:hypothetical protein
LAKPYTVCTPVETQGGKTFWRRLGSAWPAKSGDGWNLQLDAVPINGKLSIFPPREGDRPVQEKPPVSTAPSEPIPEMDDEIPF